VAGGTQKGVGAGGGLADGPAHDKREAAVENVDRMGLLEVSGWIRRREITAEAVTRQLLDRIERLEPRLNSVVMLLAETALAQAQQADREIAGGFWRGPLHGVPIGIKDLLWTKGLPTTAGMELNREFRPSEDATVVERLKRAGAVIIAKLHMTEGATFDHHPAWPRPANPWSAAHWTGVSSSGSGVAVAAGLCFGAIGTDTGGSIRMPSAANSLTGIKPTWGRVSRHGLMHLSESLDHIGPMARSAGDAAAILQAIAGADPRDPTALAAPVPDYVGTLGAGVSGLVVGVDWDFVTEDVAPEAVAALRAAAETLQGLGVRLREVKTPRAGDAWMTTGAMFAAEIAAAHAEHFPAKADRYGPRTRQTFAASQALDGVTVARAYQARDRFRSAMHAVFADCDLLLTPAFPIVLPTWEAVDAIIDDMQAASRYIGRFTMPFNLAGTPTISLPAGFTDEGLPIGVQLVGAPLAEPVLIRAGAAFQRATDHHTRRPPLD
jgi:amidase